MNGRKRFAAALMTCCLVTTLSAQDKQHWSELMKGEDVNLYEVQEAFNEAWDGKEIAKGKGYKQFKRWEYFWEPRLFPSGEMIAPDAVYKEVQKARGIQNRLSSQAGTWTYFGNTSIPSGGGGVGRVNMVRTDPGNSSTYFACAPAGGLWRSTNAGGSWSLMNTDDLGSIGVSDVAIDPTNSNIMYLATGDGDAGDTYALGVLKSTDGGGTWGTTGLSWTVQQVRRCNRIIVDPSTPSTLLVATTNGIYRSDDSGVSFTQELTGNYKDVQFKTGDSSVVFAVGNSDDFFYSTDNGQNWTQSTSGLPTSGVNRMALTVGGAAASSTLYILAGSSSSSGFYGYYRSQDDGVTWTAMAVFGDAGVPNLLGWDVAGGDTSGQSWYDLTTACDPNAVGTVYVGGVNTWKSTDGGATWVIVGHWHGDGGTPYVHADVHGMWFIPGTSNLLVGCDGGVFRTMNGGASFTDLSSNLEIAQIYRLGLNQQDQNQVFTGWQDNGSNLKTGSSWTRPIGGDGFESLIDHTDPDIMYGTIYYGRIYKSTNNGGSFSTIVNSGGTAGTEDENGAWLTPYVMSENDHNKLVVAKNDLHISLDAGSTWTSYPVAGGNSNGLAIAKSNENYIYVSKGSTLYLTTDGGATFNTIDAGVPNNSITYIAVDPLDEERVWVTLSGFSGGNKVFYSGNAGGSWSNVSSGIPNIPANCIVYHEGTNDGLYVGTDAGVYYRDATSPSWQLYSDGLPNVVVSELEIQYASSTIVAATYGRGVWKAPLFQLPTEDAGIVSVDTPNGLNCDQNITPSITVANFGSDVVTEIEFSYGWNGVEDQSYTWNGSLASVTTTSVTLPTSLRPLGGFTFVISVTGVNGTPGDENASNDSGSAYYSVNGNDDTVTLDLLTDCWASETSWELRTDTGILLASGSGYSNQTNYTADVCLANGCYEFEMFDSYGDGMTSSCGAVGDYTLTDSGGTVLAEIGANPNFGFSQLHPFCISVAVLGCTNGAACNYDPAATADDGSCIVPDGCMDMAACNFNPLALCDDGSCLLPDGCTDDTACNYDIAALCDDGSCILPDGCTDPLACNYDVGAACDDGSCQLPDGCTDDTACNYNVAALCDDGSCEFASCDCPGDLTGDGQVNSSDLLMVIADFGCIGSCVADLTDDFEVDTSDLLFILAQFGNICF